jgi:hypothetical protein
VVPHRIPPGPSHAPGMVRGEAVAKSSAARPRPGRA